MTEWVAIGVSIVALSVSGAMALREWRAKPDLRLYLDWIVGGGPTTFRIIVENRGRARGTVRDIVVSPTATYDTATAYVYLAHLDDLPMMLDAGAVAHLPVVLDPNAKENYSRRLLDGGFTHAILIDGDDVSHAFLIPAKPDGAESRVSRAGNVRRK